MQAHTLKLIHVSCVVLSYTLFVLRGFWAMYSPARLRQRWVRVLPHSIDTLLLGSAIALALQLQLSPLHTPWLLSKIVALLLYIALGMLAIRHGKTRRVRLSAWFAAQLVFFYIVGVALTRDPQPWHALSP
ncbi:MAG TPA: SirB2 family protein [Gallionellaceae bacterium]|nr:SirB2 family protein [Gallionellaceae bacterium]